MLRSAVWALIVLVVLSMTTSCSLVSSWFGNDDPAKPTTVSAFDVTVGECFLAPKAVTGELADLSKVPCSVKHQQELFAKATFEPPAGTTASADIAGDTYPGDAALDTFAKGACAEAFTGYVGIAYPDSGLWMTYLLPSARSWQQGDDRAILCFVTTTGASLTTSVKGSKL
ncbi:MAG: septum formation family protein [Nakamurella sp.]